jgi:pimeloyl-ACP methyl ester carboxylesterase
MPGLAASPKIFEFLKFPEDYEIMPMHFIIPYKNETLRDYSKRLIKKQIKHHDPILLGVSFGGMIIQEISKLIPVKKLILVSTLKSSKEFSPFYNKVLRYRLYKFYPSRAMMYTDLLEKLSFPGNFKQKMKLYKKYRDSLPKEYYDWAVKNLAHWSQPEFPSAPFIHIHGTEDKVFPIKYIREPVTKIDHGRHDMIIFRAHWFNEHWNEILK